MNSVCLIGRPTSDPEIRYDQEGKAIARITLAVDRDKEGADFISCNAFGKTAEVIEKYVRKGKLLGVEGRIRTGSYTNKNNQKVYTTDVMVNRIKFCESKSQEEPKEDEFMSIPDGLDEELPFA